MELIGDIVKLVSLPKCSDAPTSFESSVKMVAGARNPREFNLSCPV